MANDRIKGLIKQLRKVDSSFISLQIRRIVKENQKYIINLNVNDQLFDRGIYNDGTKLPLPYAPKTIIDKTKKGQPTDKITLRDTGSFHSKFYIIYEKNQFSLWSRDGKTETLVKDWGEEIFGLTDENIETVIINFILPGLQKEIKKLIDAA